MGRDRKIGMEQEIHLQEELEPSEVNRRFVEIQKPFADTWLMWETGIRAAALWWGGFSLSFEC